MKKSKFLILFMVMFMLNCGSVFADSLSVASNTKSIVVGKTVNVTATVASSAPLVSVEGKLVCSGAGSGSVSMSFDDSSNSIKTKTFNLTVKGNSVGTIECKVSDGRLTNMSSDKWINLSSNKISITVNEKAKETPKSSINYLSSLSVEGVELSPAFDKNTMDYEVTLESDVTKIKIEGTKENSVSYVTGLGEFDVSEGLNNLQVIVTAENGAVRTYNIKATVLEQSPIIVNVDGEEKTLVRKSEFLPSTSDYYVLDSIEMEESSIPAYYNETINYYLVGLKDTDGNISLYRYNKDDNTYTKYNASSFSSINFVFLKSDSIPKGYKEDRVVINNIEVTCYTKKDELPLVYGINLEDGNTGFYSYDSSQNTIQKYIFSKNNDDLKFCVAIISLGILCLVELLVILKLLSSKNNKMKKDIQEKLNKNTNYKEEIVKEEPVKQEKKQDIKKPVKESKPEKVKKTKPKNKDRKSMFGYKKLNDTGYIISGVSEVFDNSDNEKQLFKSKDDEDDDMYHF